DNRIRRLLRNDLVDVGAMLPQSLVRWAGKDLGSESTLPKSLKRTGEPAVLGVTILTEGEGNFVVGCSGDDQHRDTSPFPKGIHPVADVEFPAKKAGAPAIKKRYPLDRFCCDGYFQGPVAVPEEAGAGKARLAFSFAAWEGAKVAPATVEI